MTGTHTVVMEHQT